MNEEIAFDEHPRFHKDFKTFCKKHQQGILALRYLKNLLSIHFAPVNKNNPCFTLKTLHRVDRIGPNVVVYKVTMNTKGLSSGQSPRICIWVRGPLITFLCMGSHVENYKDSELKEELKKCIKDLDNSVVFS